MQVALKLAAQIQQPIFQGEMKQIFAVHAPQIMQENVLKLAAQIHLQIFQGGEADL